MNAIATFDRARAGAFVAGFFCVLLVMLSVAEALDLIRAAGIDIYEAQLYALMYALALAASFLIRPGRGSGAPFTPAWYDWLMAAAGFVCSGYLAWEFQSLSDAVFLRPADAVATGIILVLLTLEALRRYTGWALPAICAAFILYSLLGQVLPDRLAAQPNDVGKLAMYLAVDLNGIYGTPMAVACTVIIAFLLFGQLLNETGGGQFFTDMAIRGMGRLRGGPAKVAVVGSCLFGSISGSAVANVVATGIVTIPMIKRTGYPGYKAGAIEAVASTGGQLMPPVMGAAAFLVAQFLAIPYAEVVLAALIPGLLYYYALFVMADLEAVKAGITGISGDEMPPLRRILVGTHFILPFVVLIGALFWFNQSPEFSALLAAAVMLLPALLIGYGGKRANWRVLFSAIRDAGLASLEIILVCAGAGIVIGALQVSGLSFNLTLVLVQVGEGSLLLLLLIAAAVCVVLGMGMPTVGVYVLLAALVAPALERVGVEPIAAHLYVMYFGMMSMITPPVAIAAFAAAGIAKADPMRTGWEAVRFGWIAYVIPILFVLSPSLLLIGETTAVVIALVTSVAGIYMISVAMVGYFVRPLAPALRAGLGISGLLAFIPAGAFEGAVITDIIGIVLGLVLLGYEWTNRRRKPAGPVTDRSGAAAAP